MQEKIKEKESLIVIQQPGTNNINLLNETAHSIANQKSEKTNEDLIKSLEEEPMKKLR